jgi:hypothetical protein
MHNVNLARQCLITSKILATQFIVSMTFGKEGGHYYLLEAQPFPLIFIPQILPVRGVATLEIILSHTQVQSIIRNIESDQHCKQRSNQTQILNFANARQ